MTRSTGSTARAYQVFWTHLMAQVEAGHPDWLMPSSPPPRNWLPVRTEISCFSYGFSFGHRGLCSELYIRVPNDAPAGQRILGYLESNAGQLEAAYGGKLSYEYLSRTRPGRIACRLADYRPGVVLQTSEHDAYLAWFLHSQARLRHAIGVFGGLAHLRDQASS